MPMNWLSVSCPLSRWTGNFACLNQSRPKVMSNDQGARQVQFPGGSVERRWRMADFLHERFIYRSFTENSELHVAFTRILVTTLLIIYYHYHYHHRYSSNWTAIPPQRYRGKHSLSALEAWLPSRSLARLFLFRRTT